MEVKVIYDPFLRRTAKAVTVFDEELKKEAAEMLKAMKSHDGLGLAGVQVGLDKRLIVMGYEPKDAHDELPRIPEQALVNPKVLKFSKEKETMTEGCLSLPGLELPVERSAGVTVAAQNLDGKPVTIKAKGIFARILQHEIDHINGILFTDYALELNKLENYQFAKIVFLGSDDFSNVIFNALIDAKQTVMAAITETAKRAGRGNETTEPVVKTNAEQAGIAVFQPDDKPELTKIIQQLKPDLLVLASYGKILPAEALVVPKYGSLNIHPSLLPKYRGATPIQTAILSGDKETGVTIMTMEPKVDAGGVVAQEKLVIAETDDFPTLKNKAAELGAKLLLKNLPVYLSGQAKIQPQNEQAVTGTTKLTKEMGEIDWSLSPEQIDRQIRAFTPWPGTFTVLNGQRLKIIAAHLENGKLVLDTVQLEGKQPANWADFKRGYANQLTKESWFSIIA
ncbi:MAG TPA: methionyl-tRNA formyltransferase [Candidatus Saccharimonadales bacterium]|nr:methionyl-tRNA formyltransferase [Candidatus Saccharimonadales bacterium]